MKIGAQAFPHGPPATKMVSTAHRYGFQVLEVVLEPPNTLRSFVTRKRQQLKESAHECNMRLLIHAPFSSLDPASPSRIVRENAFNELVETIRLAHDIEAQLVTIHAPDYSRLTKRVLTSYVNTMSRLIGISEEKGVNIAIENTFQNFKQFLKIFNKIDFPNVFITFDPGHANLFSDPLKFLQKIPYGKIINVHLHDNNGKKDDHLPIGRGKMDFLSILRELKKLHYDGPLIIEHISIKEFIESKRALEEILKAL